jgi:hypothetical protein
MSDFISVKTADPDLRQYSLYRSAVRLMPTNGKTVLHQLRD